MPKPRLRHIALSVDDPVATAGFYRKAFDLEKVGETDSPLARGVYLWDGTICLAILNFKRDRWAGEDRKAECGGQEDMIEDVALNLARERKGATKLV